MVTWYLVPGTWYLVSGTQYPVPSSVTADPAMLQAARERGLESGGGVPAIWTRERENILVTNSNNKNNN